MRRTICFLGFFLLIGAAAHGSDDSLALQGTWTMAVGFIDGTPFAADDAKLRELVIERNEYRSTYLGEVTSATIKIDASQIPKEIDFSFTEGEFKGQAIKGIYKLAGGDLTICRGRSGKDFRPVEFAAPAGSGLSLVTWKRSKTPATAATATKELIDSELKRLSGTWRFLEEEAEGVKIPEDVFAKDSLVLDGQHFVSVVATKRVEGEFKVDPTVHPKSIDITFTDGPWKGQTHKGIYEVNGDIQRFCIAGPNKPRPDAFVSKPASGHIVQVLERVKP
jgi:uncharacterized protein (TIGR03067 family)